MSRITEEILRWGVFRSQEFAREERQVERWERKGKARHIDVHIILRPVFKERHTRRAKRPKSIVV